MEKFELGAAEIKALRLALGWTQKQLAQAAKAHQVTVANWEAGRPVRSESHRALLRSLAARVARKAAG
jgi:transcriptional regulator with XRE-family HTH domain